MAAVFTRTSTSAPAEIVLVVADSVSTRFPVTLKLVPAPIVVSAVADPFTWIVAVAVADAVVEYAAAATRIHEYGVTNPFAWVPNVLFRTVVANSALGKLYCNTFPALAFPPKLIGNPPGVAHVGTVPVVLSI